MGLQIMADMWDIWKNIHIEDLTWQTIPMIEQPITFSKTIKSLFNGLVHDCQQMITARNNWIKYSGQYVVFNANVSIEIYVLEISNDIGKWLQFILTWITICYKYTDCSHKHCEIVIVMCPETKEWDGISTLTGVNVNSGITTSCPDEIVGILVYRFEEWKKVFIHETIHSMGFDKSHLKYEHMYTETSKKLGFNKTVIAMFEAYTEFWAEIWMCVITSQGIQKDLIKTCVLFSCVQLKKLEELLKDRENYVETTHIIAYYDVKCSLLCNLAETLEWCKMYNDVNCVWKLKDMGKLCEYIEKIYWNDLMQYYLSVVYIDDAMKKTMRMTLFE